MVRRLMRLSVGNKSKTGSGCCFQIAARKLTLRECVYVNRNLSNSLLSNLAERESQEERGEIVKTLMRERERVIQIVLTPSILPPRSGLFFSWTVKSTFFRESWRSARFLLKFQLFFFFPLFLLFWPILILSQQLRCFVLLAHVTDGSDFGGENADPWALRHLPNPNLSTLSASLPLYLTESP